MLLLFGLFILPPASCQEESNYTFSKYSSVLQNELFPKIQSCIQSFQFTPPNQEKANKLSEEVFKIIESFRKERKLVYYIPPRVAVIKVENLNEVVYILEIKLEMFDEESSIKGVLVTSLLFGKRFVILIKHREKSSPDIEA